MKTFEWFVAWRYLRARRKQTVISVVTLISILGVTAGVAAMVVALSISSGFRKNLQDKLLKGTAHLNVKPVLSSEGIGNPAELTSKIRKVPGIRSASAALYGPVLMSTGSRQDGVMLKGIAVDDPLVLAQFFQVRQGDLGRLAGNQEGPVEDRVAVGVDLAERLGLLIGDTVGVFSDETTLTPLGEFPLRRRFKVVAIFQSGLYDFDAHWAFTALSSAQRALGTGQRASVIECRVEDIYQVERMALQIKQVLGEGFETIDWKELNRPVFEALRLEKLVMVITIGLIVFVAALNIVTTLTMMVMEKTRDIAILMSMGATRKAVRKIFIFQGVTIGVIGSFWGLIFGYSLCWICDRYRLIRLQADVYSMTHVPFNLSVADGVAVAAAAIIISFLATLYPSDRAAGLNPVEALRYE
jgi:lipoprotein-releasing system permease protein